jgi:hypothetical protein
LLVVVALALAGGFYLGLSRENSGVTDRGTVAGLIEYTVRDASGNIKMSRLIHNTTMAALLNDARARLGVDGTTLASNNSDLYDNIQACSAATSGASCTLSSALDANPADGTNTSETESGNYKVVKTFTASGASTIAELQLTRGAATSGTAETNIGAFQGVSITLANGDTLQITWTIDID